MTNSLSSKGTEGRGSEPAAPDRASKLSQLRTAIAAIPAFRTARGTMTPKRRRDVLASTEGLCAGCDGPLTGQPWIADHRLPLELGGADTLQNLQPLCVNCNRSKTRNDAKQIAKMRRQSKMDEPREASRLQSRNEWPKGQRIGGRKFNGEPILARKA